LGSNAAYTVGEAWITKYIFSNGMLPSIASIGKSVEGLFVMEDWHNLNTDYEKTLFAWLENFETNWPKIQANYPGNFYRMWKYYLLSCAGSFRARNMQLWQVVLSKNGVLGNYQSVR
jgi:cyclopropane-fatty-acyl-phospholipid synthase